MKRAISLGLAPAACAPEPPLFEVEAASLKLAAGVERGSRSNIVRLFSVILPLLIALPLLFHLPAVAQNGPPKDFRFEVISIRPVNAASPYGTARFGALDPEPNGFRSTLSVMQMVYLAYVSANSHVWGTVKVLNLPAWQGQFYDVAAKVSQADLTAWQHQGPEQELLRAAMRTALRERLKVAIHEQPSTGEIFELVVAKAGVRLKPTAPANDPRPPGLTEKDRPAGGGMVQATENGRSQKIFWDRSPGGTAMVLTVENGQNVKTMYENRPGGGVLRHREAGPPKEHEENGGRVVTFYNATVKDLAYYLDLVAGGALPIPVRDKTHLTGRYDFTITRLPRDPDQNEVFRFSLKPLGLQLKHGTEQRPALVVDHIERASPN